MPLFSSSFGVFICGGRAVGLIDQGPALEAASEHGFNTSAVVPAAHREVRVPNPLRLTMTDFAWHLT